SLLALAAVAAIAVVVWCAGELAGWVVTGTWPPTPPSSAPALVVGLVEHPGRPWAGWPLPYRELAAGEYYVVLATVLAAAVGLGWSVAAGWRRWAGDTPTSRARSHSTAWARSRELRPL